MDRSQATQAEPRQRAMPIEGDLVTMLSNAEQRPAMGLTPATVAQFVGISLRLPGVFASMYDAMGVYRWVSARFASELGVEAGSLRGRSLHDVFSQPWAEQRLELMKKVVAGGVPQPTIEIFRGRRIEGLKVPVLIGSLPGIISLGRFASSTRPDPKSPDGLEPIQLRTADWGPLSVLSRRELEVLRLVAMGLENDEIAQRVHRTKRAVEWHMQHLYENLACRSRVELFRYGIEAGLASIDDAHWEAMLDDLRLSAERSGAFK